MRRHAGGRPSMYTNTQEDLGKFQEATYNFLADIIGSGKHFSMKLWAEYLGITRQTLYNYRKRGEGWATFMVNTLCVYAIMKTEATLRPTQAPRPQYHYWQLNEQN